LPRWGRSGDSCSSPSSRVRSDSVKR
jgi:hypothetical protein